MFPSWETFKSAVVFTLFSKGIPIFYYGDEQGFAGGKDPGCRETLWTNMDEQHELYKYVQKVNKIRTEKEIWNHEAEEIWVEDDLYVIRRGKNTLIAITNQKNDSRVSHDISNAEFKEGDKYCNLLFTGDCVKVENGKLNVTLLNGESKIFEAQSDQQDIS